MARIHPEDHPLVYVSDQSVYAIDREKGTLKWKYDADKRIVRMLLAHDCVYLLDVECVVHCVKAKAGELLGKVSTGSTTAVGASMIQESEDARIYVATTDGVYAITPRGKKVWSFESPSPDRKSVV